ncbi:hypothetical protein B4U79_16503 [Dinothrombium tinctorium]|uniref:Uncharacterized protein n=1 Tax=Dinothrombium tinctorium TaxID=1965070 RepID=A0A3S3NPH7_9ACAR|nr:hypothetical protein B4U79_16503 [Dinothrombium tinctorium]
MDKFHSIEELFDFLQRLQQLMECNTFKDVTFVCKDGSVAANRLLLSLYSDFLSQLFAENPAIVSHPTLARPDTGINLVDVSVRDLENLLLVLHSANAVEMSADRISSLNYVAKQLQIKIIANKLPNGAYKVRPIVQHLFLTENQLFIDNNHENSVSNSKRAVENGTEEDSACIASKESINHLQTKRSQSNLINESIELSQSKLQEMFTKQSYCEVSDVDEFKFKCKVCPKKYKFPKDLKSHFKIEHLGVMYTCNLCHAVKYRWPQDVCKHLNSKHMIKDNFMSFYSVVQNISNEEIYQNAKFSVHNLSEAVLNVIPSQTQQSSSSLEAPKNNCIEKLNVSNTSNIIEPCTRSNQGLDSMSKLTYAELQEMYNSNNFFERPENFENNKFECKLCFKRYKFLKGIKMHFKNAHLEATYICNLCRNRYRWPQDVGKHLKKKHGKFGDLRDFYSMVNKEDSKKA